MFINAVDSTLHYLIFIYMTYPNWSLNLPVTGVNNNYESSPTILGKKNIAPLM